MTTAKGRPKGGLAEKRSAILTGALTVFARDGYARASIDAISAEAGVSTRTIYNHFQDKAELFGAVIQESATRIADAQTVLIDQYLRKVTDVEADLADLGRAWLAPVPGYADHFALVRQINADSAHLPPDTIEAWLEAGPRRVRQALAGHLARLAGLGLLRVDDPGRAAQHFTLLLSTVNPANRGDVSEAEIDEVVVSGVHAFLYGYHG
jgi:AcrR family transcriptional regulator